jgi:hypothetical protein
MPSSGMRRRVAIVRTDDSEECIASIIRVKGISELGATLAVTNNCWYVSVALAFFMRKRFLLDSRVKVCPKALPWFYPSTSDIQCTKQRSREVELSAEYNLLLE